MTERLTISTADIIDSPGWVRRVQQVLLPLLPKDFVGQLEINVFKDGITNINVKQSFK